MISSGRRPALLLCLLLPLLLLWSSGCNTTRHLKEGEYLLRRNKLDIHSDQPITRKGQLNDQLASLLVQKPNSYPVLGLFPYKLWLYNLRYKRFQRNPEAEAFQIKARTVERPVIYDSTKVNRSVLNLKGFLANQGYFYAQVWDTTTFSGKKATVSYKVETGLNFLINEVKLDIDDSAVRRFVQESLGSTVFARGKAYSNTLAEGERSRITNLLRDRGYYKFTQENIYFQLDTVNKAFLRDVDNPFESAIGFVALQKREAERPTLDVRIIIRRGDELNAYRRYGIGRVTVYPDFVDTSDIRDPEMLETWVDSVRFRYHNYYVREKVMLSHIFIVKDEYYSQANYDRTITKLNELGIFQYVRIIWIEDSTLPADRPLRCVIVLNPTRKLELSTNFEISNASTYQIGSAVSVTLRNRNLLKGANQLGISLIGGVEMGSPTLKRASFRDYFKVQSENLGANATLEFPKFIAPISDKTFSRYNTPRTIVGVGTSVLRRIDYFTLTNTTANFTYNWRETATKTWDLSPAFINVQRLPRVYAAFQERLQSNQFLRNSYRENFIEGENLTFTFSDQNVPRRSFSYSYIRASIEEAGGLVSGINALTRLFSDTAYQQYVKLDIDARRYIPIRHSLIAARFFAGVGIPYNYSTTLPYIRQYFVGGPYSIRGWSVRSLGPGSFRYPETDTNSGSRFIDNTGDIKLEAMLEYRFDIVQLFSGAMQLNGAVFTDAGNIWLAKPSAGYPGGEIGWKKFGRDIAMSSGAGLRLDIGGLFVVRFDAAFPIKKPYSPRPGGWAFQDILSYHNWWLTEVNYNIAIGYPF